MSDQLTTEEQELLLQLARQALEEGVSGGQLESIDMEDLPPRLRRDGVSFVTLTSGGRLRGCIGALEANHPLAEDVRQHAVAAALHDYRFPPVQIEELEDISIEISHLTEPKPLEYIDPDDLLTLIHPGVHGVVIRDGMRRATFLPQVWEKIPEPESFLSSLCQKMGASPDLWRRKIIEVLIYQVEEFRE